MVEVCFVCCADIVVVAPEAMGDEILGGWIHDGCDELDIGIIRSRFVIISQEPRPVSSLYIYILGSVQGPALFE
jgi:hypothetical protein